MIKILVSDLNQVSDEEFENLKEKGEFIKSFFIKSFYATIRL